MDRYRSSCSSHEKLLCWRWCHSCWRRISLCWQSQEEIRSGVFCFLHQVLDDFYRIFCSSICLLVVWRWFRVNNSQFSCEILKFLWAELRTVVRNDLIWNSIPRNIFFQKLNGVFGCCASKLFNFNVPREVVDCYDEMLSIVHHKIDTYFLPWSWRFYANHGFCHSLLHYLHSLG